MNYAMWSCQFSQNFHYSLELENVYRKASSWKKQNRLCEMKGSTQTA